MTISEIIDSLTAKQTRLTFKDVEQAVNIILEQKIDFHHMSILNGRNSTLIQIKK